MNRYNISAALAPLEQETDGNVLVLLTSEELERGATIPGLERVLCHTPSARDARVCKAEARRDCLCGTIVTPRCTRDGAPIAFGYLLTPGWMVLCDDTGTAHSAVQRLRKENAHRENGIGGFFYEFIELLIAKDLHHLQGIGDRLERLEDQVLSGEMEGFNPKMTALRKEIAGWMRYYTQLDDMVCEFHRSTKPMRWSWKNFSGHRAKRWCAAEKNTAGKPTTA